MTPVAAGAELLVVFVKYPVPGRVKTRLAAGLGGERAVSIYRELVDLTLAEATRWQRGAHQSGAGTGSRHLWICFDPPEACEQVRAWLQPQVSTVHPPVAWVPQSGTDLGERMLSSLYQGFKSRFSAICIIGTDCPALTDDRLHEAFRRLADRDVVVGPATDGGYYLIGLKNVWESLFINIPWSSNATLSATLAQAEALRLQVALLPPLDDIDTERDWYRWSRTTKIVTKNLKLL